MFEDEHSEAFEALDRNDQYLGMELNNGNILITVGEEECSLDKDQAKTMLVKMSKMLGYWSPDFEGLMV